MTNRMPNPDLPTAMSVMDMTAVKYDVLLFFSNWLQNLDWRMCCLFIYTCIHLLLNVAQREQLSTQ